MLLVLGALVSADARAANAQDGVPIHAGPVFTRGDEAGSYPKYPDVQIEVDVPLKAGQELQRAEAFSLKPDNGPAVYASRVQTLASSGYGIAASVSLDVSGSMKGKPLNAVRSGLIKFVNEAGPQDKVAIQTIADEGRWDADWDAPREQVRTALDNLATRGTLTRLWDALLEAIQHFPVMPLSRRLIVISDGHDEGSSHREEEVIAAAREHGVIVDAIGMTRSDPIYLRSLETLAAQTGGLFREAKDTSDLESLIGGGIERLKSTPVVSFRLNDLAGDGKTHLFNVIWRHDGTESSAETTASIPLIRSSKWTRSYWAAGIVCLVAMLIVVLVLLGKSHKVGPGVTQVEPAPNALPMEQPISDPALLPRPIPPRPFVVGQAESAAPLRPRRVVSGDEPALRFRARTELIARFPVPSPGRPAGWLYCEEGFAVGRRFPVDELEYWIGALENNHLQIKEDRTVSGNHACLKFDHDVLGIYDHHSTNGTRVNGEAVGEKRRLLRLGDRIRIGDSVFVLQPAEKQGAGV